MNHEKKRNRLIELLVVMAIIFIFPACDLPFSVNDPIPIANSDELSDREWPAVVRTFRRSIRSKDINTYSRAALALRRWMMDHDPHYPIYHFAGPESWINDANGVIYHKGLYHLFYQYDPILPDGTRSERCWGHAVSKDLVHWKDWPVALWPDSPYDRKGVYSGNVIIDDEGIPTALYTGNIAGGDEAYGMLARSTDGFLTWNKKLVMHDNQRPNDASPVHWDAQIWKSGNEWYQLIGGSTGGDDPHGAAFLWTSPDLENWELQTNIAPILHLDNFWELPYLVPLDGVHVLMVGVEHNPYWVGEYDEEKRLFTPFTKEPRSVDMGDFYAVNPHMTDDKGPTGASRRLLHAWITTPPSPTKTVPYWEGAHAIPRVLSIRNGRLWQEPIPELRVLRHNARTVEGKTVSPGKTLLLNNIWGDALEIKAEFRIPEKGSASLRVRASADGTGGVSIWYDRGRGIFGVDDVETSVPLDPDASIGLHIFVDRSIVEAYLDGHAITKVTFVDPDDQALAVFAEETAAKLVSFKAWDIRSNWPR
jgi:beta-fructofuranosidase